MRIAHTIREHTDLRIEKDCIQREVADTSESEHIRLSANGNISKGQRLGQFFKRYFHKDNH